MNRLAISYERLPGFGPAWQAVVAEHPDAEWLFAQSSAHPQACRTVAEERLRNFPFYAEAAGILHAEGLLYGVPEETLARLKSLAEGRAVVVVTGQQVGFLGGPLFTFIKAYHAVRLARALEATLKLPVLPLFWLEGEDHDLQEIRASRYPQADGTLGAMEFSPAKEVAHQEVGRYAVGEQALAGLHELLAQWGNVSGEAAEALEHAYGDGDLSTAFGRLLAATLGPRGLLICEGRNERLKQLALPLWERAIDARRELHDAFQVRSDEVRMRGYSAPMSPTPDAHFFYVVSDDYVRRPVLLDGAVKHPDGSSEQVTAVELKSRLRSGTWQVSPKAALRPLFQDFVLPTVAYVGGPGELEYHAQLAPFYQMLGVTAPSLFPRMSATLVDQKCERLREKLGLTWEELLTTSEPELSKRVLRAADEQNTSELFAGARAEIEAVFQKLKPALETIDPTLAGALGSSAGKALHPLEQLEQKANKAIKQQHAVELARLHKVLFAAKPGGKPMERIYGTAWALAHYGVTELLELMDKLPADGAAHQIVITE
ncbi:MAG: bacillithiol biosynthesis cysteine-adding enzyme BshC [bacterium]|nr:bacillithiol biosynthesis cysteine-adding enzyme BshC [bacterium]